MGAVDQGLELKGGGLVRPSAALCRSAGVGWGLPDRPV